MGGGRNASGALVYIRKNGTYLRRDGKPVIHKNAKEPELTLDQKRQNAVNTISKATNKQELITAMKDIGLEGKTSFITEMKNFESSKQIATALADMNAVFGSDVLDDVTTKGKFGNADGYRVTGKNTIHLNPKAYSNLDAMQKQCDFESHVRYSYKNQTPQSIVKHEYAHLLEDKLINNVKKSYAYQKAEADIKAAQNEINRVTQNIQTEWKKASDLLDKASQSKTMSTRIKYATQADKIMQNALNKQDYYSWKKAVNMRAQNMNNKVRMIRHGQESEISNIFHGLGKSTPRDVGIALTGNKNAYASTNWHEAHAECIADYMTNGQKASDISKAYIQVYANKTGLSI